MSPLLHATFPLWPELSHACSTLESDSVNFGIFKSFLWLLLFILLT